MKTKEKPNSTEPVPVESHPVPAPMPAQAPASMQAPPLSPAAQAFLAKVKGRRETPSKIPLVSIAHREGGFKMPTGDIVPTISGYPLYYFNTRKYYKKPPQAGQKGAPPDCWSSDCLVPHSSSLEKQSQTCASCTMNQFGTGRDGRSKACGMPTWIFLVNPEFGTPPIVAVAFPSSSLRALFGTRFESGYFNKVQAKHGAYEIVWTTFSLKQMGDNVIYCVAEPTATSVLGTDDMDKIEYLANLREQMVPVMEEFRMQTPSQEVEQ